jgi:hypothetical protein
VNTEKDDQYISALANGRYLLKESMGKFKVEVTEYLIPEDIRPHGVMKVEGIVSNNNTPVSSYISVVDANTQERIFSGRPATDGTFFLFLKEGGMYDLSIDPEDGALTYYTKRYDLTKNESLRNEKLSVSLTKMNAGYELILDAIRFKPYTSELENSSEFNKVARLLKNNTAMNFEIQVTLNGYTEDTTRVNPDLTEETAYTSTETFTMTDSLGNITTQDSVMMKTMYHNNRTEQQANAIVEKLVALGIDRNNLLISTNKKVLPVEAERNTEVKIIARAKE